MNNTEKTSMVLYESTFKTMELILKDDSAWREAMTGLLRFGFYNEEPESDNPLVQAIYVSSLPSMKTARERWEKAIENGKKGGRPTEVPIEDILIMKSKGMTNKEISEQIGCTVKNIENRITNYNKAYPNNPNNLSVSEDDYVYDSVSESEDEGANAPVESKEIEQVSNKNQKRGIEDLSYAECINLIQDINNKIRYPELMKKYNLYYIDKDKLDTHCNKLENEKRLEQEKARRQMECKEEDLNKSIREHILGSKKPEKRKIADLYKEMYDNKEKEYKEQEEKSKKALKNFLLYDEEYTEEESKYKVPSRRALDDIEADFVDGLNFDGDDDI